MRISQRRDHSRRHLSTDQKDRPPRRNRGTRLTTLVRDNIHSSTPDTLRHQNFSEPITLYLMGETASTGPTGYQMASRTRETMLALDSIPSKFKRPSRLGSKARTPHEYTHRFWPNETQMVSQSHISKPRLTKT